MLHVAQRPRVSNTVPTPLPDTASAPWRNAFPPFRRRASTHQAGLPHLSRYLYLHSTSTWSNQVQYSAPSCRQENSRRQQPTNQPTNQPIYDEVPGRYRVVTPSLQITHVQYVVGITGDIYSTQYFVHIYTYRYTDIQIYIHTYIIHALL